MKKKNIKLSNIIFFVIIGLLLIPQTRKPIQVFIHKGLALLSPSTIEEKEQRLITDYDWTLKDSNGKTFNFSETKGKVVLINFWATWCPPCIAEMPSMQALYDDYSSQIEFVFVSNETFEVTQQFMLKKGYTFETYIPFSEYPNTFDVNSIPRTFLMDQSGRIIIDKSGAANWNSKSVRATIDALIK
ncbi:TlpA family protein disulfide reductase [Changchengzhania lutea]|uniref:TlpA family protein disulfide reductase n=1 Tax=Changchengzhania lutea TaxID=2049305 RepID=UPI00115CA224|nr:TlpA disulfide reductase family protein [Changchengzhania lutea]